jgi:hypothetical protein
VHDGVVVCGFEKHVVFQKKYLGGEDEWGIGRDGRVGGKRRIGQWDKNNV